MLKALFAEDDRLDVELVQRELNGLAEVEQIATRDKFKEALAKPCDVILMDLRMMEWDGADAMAIAKEMCPETPVIIVTGSVDDETASISCQKGAVDYLRKDRLRRLRIAVLNAVESAAIKRDKEKLKLEMERLERESWRTQRRELLGELVVGIAHDMNNILGVLVAGIEILRTHVQNLEGNRILDVMLSSSRRASEMQRQMLAFGKGGDGGEQQRVSAEYLLGEISSMLRGTFPSNIRLLVRTSVGTAQIKCDATQVNQVLLNLAVNARDAMPNGGELIISAQNVTLPEGLFVCITVRDTGTGIPESILPHIFEPFYTSKGDKGGSGVGLAMVKNIIAAHGGKVDVRSKAGDTEFSVYLPVSADATPKKTQHDGGGKRVLLAEDTEFLRTWMALLLRDANYVVHEAVSGPEAMNLFLANIESIDVLLSDVGMPLMSGTQLAEALLKLKPGLPVLFITGLESEGALKHTESASVLHKPFSSASLLQTLKDILNPT